MKPPTSKALAPTAAISSMSAPVKGRDALPAETANLGSGAGVVTNGVGVVGGGLVITVVQPV